MSLGKSMDDSLASCGVSGDHCCGQIVVNLETRRCSSKLAKHEATSTFLYPLENAKDHHTNSFLPGTSPI